MTTTHTHTYDPEAVARACLAEQLEFLVDMDTSSIVELAAAAGLAVPDEDDEESWDRIGTALGRLADQIREHFGIEEE